MVSNNSAGFPEMVVNVKVTGSSTEALSKPENWSLKETGTNGEQASTNPRSVVVGSDGVCKLAYRSTLGSDSGDSRTVVVSYIDDQSHKVMDSFSYYCDAKSSTVDGYLLSESDSRRYTEAEIEEMGVYRGMTRKHLQCDKIEQNLRLLHPDLSWVSAEEKGCVLQIQVKEGKMRKEKK